MHEIERDTESEASKTDGKEWHFGSGQGNKAAKVIYLFFCSLALISDGAKGDDDVSRAQKGSLNIFIN